MNLNIFQIFFLALLQGVTELFPISSLGHTVILPSLLGWGDLVRDTHFLPLIVALHLGTSIALVIYFWRDWLQVVLTLVESVKKRGGADRHNVVDQLADYHRLHSGGADRRFFRNPTQGPA